jgi:hypothetical protein
MGRPLEVANCICHGEIAYWQIDKRMVAGGWWRCAVRKRASSRVTDAARATVKNQRTRDRYDADPVYRIGKNLHDNARRRRQTIERQRAAIATDLGATSG